MCLIFIGYYSIICGQSLSGQKELNEAFNVLIKHFKDEEDQRLDFFRKINSTVDSTDYLFKPPVLWKSGTNLSNVNKENTFTVEISDDPIIFKVKEIVLENPYGNDFPVSYSVIYKDRLISLFEQGHFVCHSIPSMQRDLSFEEKINTKEFQYHWIINNKLVGFSEGQYYYLDSNDKWLKYKEEFPLIDQPKLFEDDSYIAFCDCEGEWGGTVYFYNKATQRIFFTEATCATTVYKKEGKYYILSELAHIMGRSALKEIANPDQLTPISLDEIRKHPRGKEVNAIGYSDKSNASRNVFNLYEIGLVSTFNYEGRTIYLTDLYRLDRMFLAEIDNNTVKIVNPLFNSSIVAHYPVTTLYPNGILINMAYYRIGRYREVTCMIIKDDQIIKLNWNKQYQ